jgi:ubiquinone/menaquinone biosynthesis C-methylase UbiE
MANDSKKLSKERFGEYAAGYVTNKTHAKGAELDRLIAIAQPQADWHVLDIATGGGHTALKFAPYVKSVIASDLTPKMLDEARQFITGQEINNVTFEIADAENLPFEDAMFDLVTCRIAPHHFPDAAKFVRESARVLKAGGLFLMQDQMLPEDAAVAAIADGFEKVRDPSHNHAFSRNQWITICEAAGLTVEHTEQIVKRHDFISWAKLQGCTEETIAELDKMLAEASDAVKAWMQPEAWGTPDATFVNQHLILAARK